MTDSVGVWRDEDGVLHTVDLDVQDALRVLPPDVIRLVARRVLKPVTSEAADEWFRFDADVADASDAVMEEALTAPAGVVPVLPSVGDEPDSSDALEVPADSELQSMLAELLAQETLAERVVRLQALRALMDEWVAVTGDVEKLVGHLVLQHRQEISSAEAEAEYLLERHFLLHEEGLSPGHDI